jgi:hypothetical protein
MGIVKRTKNVVNIWPWAIWYVIIVFVIGGGFILLMNIAPILIVIFENEPLEFFGHSLHNSWLLVFTMPIALILDYLFFKTVLWKVSFTKTHIIVPKIPEIQEKRVELACNEILTCEVTMVGFNYYFMFSCLDGRKRKMSIIRFSFKQLETILQMIQERGGMVDQNINEIIKPLRIRKH